MALVEIELLVESLAVLLAVLLELDKALAIVVIVIVSRVVELVRPVEQE